MNHLLSRVPSRSKAPLKPRGLVNSGNTCFMNAVLQSLSSVKSFHVYLANQANESKPTSQILHDTLAELSLNLSQPYTPTRLASIPQLKTRFLNNEQQDAHEFLQYLFSVLDEEESINKPSLYSSLFPSKKEKPPSPLVMSTPSASHPRKNRNPFSGLLASNIQCATCGTKENFFLNKFTALSLSLPISTLKKQKKMMSPSTSPSSSPLSSSPLSSSPSSPSFFSSLASSPYISCTLEDCLEEFTSADVLQAVECHVCFSLQIMKAQTEGVSPERMLRRPPYLQQKLFVGRAPPALCLHLRRLLANMQQTFKIELKVNFPMTLDLSPYCLNEQLEEEKQSEKKKTKQEPWNEEEEVFALEEELKKCMKINHLGGADPHRTFSSRSEGFINTGHLSSGALPTSFSASTSNLFTKSQPIPINASQRASKTPPSTPPPTPTGATSKQSEKINEILYKLMAVIVHHGSETGGHFTTYRRVANPSVLLSSKDEYRAYVTSNNSSNKQGEDVWVYMSDDNCRIVSDVEEVLNCQAYMLFYEKI